MANVKVQKADTDRARFLFKVSEYGDENHTPFITTEPIDGDLAILKPGQGFLGFDLKEGTTFDQARDIAQFLNDNIETITCTTFRAEFEGIRIKSNQGTSIKARSVGVDCGTGFSHRL